MKAFPVSPRFRLPALLLALALSAPTRARPADTEPIPGPRDATSIYDSVVRIENASQVFDYRAPWNTGAFRGGNGTGFVIGPNRILTNAHVISNSRRLMIRKHNDPGVYPARVLFVAHDSDLALLELEDPSVIESAPFLELGEVPPLESEVRVIGYPIGGQRLSVTRGVVSRIDFRPYAHSGVHAHLVIQIDAAINPGNSGGPVLQGDEVVGVAFQGLRGSAEGTGYIIPTPVVRRFLSDVEDGRYDGCVDLAITTFNVFNDTFRRARNMPEGALGVVVTRVFAQGSSDGHLEPGDILLAIDDHPIFSDGRIRLEGEWVPLAEVAKRKLDGETIRMRFLRDGVETETDIPLAPFPFIRIHQNEFETRPAYAMFGGLVFQPITRNMLQAHRLDTLEIRKILDDYLTEALYLEQPEVIVLTQVLTDAINAEFADAAGLIVTAINGEPVGRMADLVRLLFEPLESGTLPEFVVIECRGAPRPFVLEAGRMREAQARIRAQYGVERDYVLPGDGQEW